MTTTHTINPIRPPFVYLESVAQRRILIELSHEDYKTRARGFLEEIWPKILQKVPSPEFCNTL